MRKYSPVATLADFRISVIYRLFFKRRDTARCDVATARRYRCLTLYTTYTYQVYVCM